MLIVQPISSIRKKYTNLLVYSTPHINPESGKKEWRLFCNWDIEDIKNILKMLEKIINSMENTKEIVTAESQKSKVRQKSEYEELVQKLKNESERKRKKKK